MVAIFNGATQPMSTCLFRLEDSSLCSVLCLFNYYAFLLNDLHPMYIQYYTIIERCVSFACCFVAAAGKMVIHKGGKASGFKNRGDADAYDKDGTALFHVKGAGGVDNTKAVQVGRPLAWRLTPA